MPAGTLIREAMPTTTGVPTAALPMPPPVMPAAGGSCVNRVRPALRSLLPPRTTSMYRTENSGTMAASAMPATRTVRKPLKAVRGWRNERSRSGRSTSAEAGTGLGFGGVSPPTLMSAWAMSAYPLEFRAPRQHQRAQRVHDHGDRQEDQGGVH